MSVTRRALLALGAAAAAGGGLFAWADGARAAFRGRIARDFGDEVAGAEATGRFLDDLVPVRGYGLRAQMIFGARPVLFGAYADEVEAEMRWMLFAFLHSTNAARVAAVGGALDYAGLFDPYAAPCSNRLAAQWE